MFTVLAVYRCDWIHREYCRKGEFYNILVWKPGGKSQHARPRLK
jgi:hypothetical protein